MRSGQLRRREFVMLSGGTAAPLREPISAEWQDAQAVGPDRRKLLKSLLAVTLAIGWQNEVVASTLPLERDRFVELSEKLCAMSIDDAFLAVQRLE
jgi:hypothetical protein